MTKKFSVSKYPIQETFRTNKELKQELKKACKKVKEHKTEFIRTAIKGRIDVINKIISS